MTNFDQVTPELLLSAYAAGVFPMGQGREDERIYWLEPEERGVFPLDGIHISRSLARTIKSDMFTVYADRDFDAVIAACAAERRNDGDTWINASIRRIYRELFHLDFVHTIECWRGEQLVGGLYGVSIGGAFFGESMFHRERDASKVALAHLAARLKLGGFRLLDTQFVTPHLASLGAVAIPRAVYRRQLAKALSQLGVFDVWPKERPVSGATVLATLADGRGSEED